MSSRLLIAVPGAIAVIAAVAIGGPLFVALALTVLIVGLFELYQMFDRYRPLRWAGYLGAISMVVLVSTVSPPERALLLGVVVSMAAVAVAGILVRGGRALAVRLGVTLLGAIYLGVPMAVLVLTRDLEHGAGAVINVLVGTWVFDSASYFGGKAWGRRPIAPNVSPNKTVEGFVVGLVGGVLAVWVAGLYMDWITDLESIIVGLAICLAAYVGDLFESRLKRDAEVKDSGTILLGHGGVLDRFDALFFSVLPAYLITVWFIV